MATKTKTKTKREEAPREHKKSWQETCATVEEIKAMAAHGGTLVVGGTGHPGR